MDLINLFSIKQNGMKRVLYECKDQLLVNCIIWENCISRHGNLNTAWIDYKEAFDSVPHSRILKTLQLCKVYSDIQNFVHYNIYFLVSFQWRSHT